MSEPIKELAVDIGGGWGEYFVGRARENPDMTFLILEPSPIKLRRYPPNLHIVKWRSEIDSDIPFTKESVDEANVNFLLGEMRDSSDSVGIGIETTLERYEKLLKDLFNVLKTGAALKIIEPKLNIAFIKEILFKTGYKIKGKPSPLNDSETTRWSKIFHDYFRSSGKSAGESFTLPMYIEAIKI